MVFLVLLACGGNGGSPENRDTLPTINEGEVSASKLSDFFNGYHFVFLETNAQSLLGASISKIVVFENYLFVMDRIPPTGEQRVMSFNKQTGSFLGQIGKPGPGPEEYSILMDFTVDRQNKTVLLYSGDDKKMLTYTLDGEFVEVIKTKDRFFLRGMAIQDSVYVVANDVFVHPKYYLLKVNRSDLSIADQQLKIQDEYSGIGKLSSYQGRFLLWLPVDTIYDVTGDDPVPTYAFRLPEKEQTEYDNIKRQPTYDLKIAKDSELFNAGLISARMSFFEGPNHLSYTKITRKEQQKPVHQTFYLFDKRDGRLYDSDHMDYDLFGGYRLPFLLESVYEDEYVSLIDPIRLLDVGKQEFLDKVTLTDEDRLRFSKLDEMANPVVLFLKEKN